MKHKTFNIRWILILIAMALALPSWAVSEKSKEMLEKNKSTGNFTLWVKGDEVDLFFKDTSDNGDHAEFFRQNRFHTIGFFENAKGSWCYKFYIQQWNGDSEVSRVISDITVFLTGNDGTVYYMGKIAHTSEGKILENHHPTLGSLETGDSDGEYLLYVSQGMMHDLGIQNFYLHFNYRIARHDFGHAKDYNYEMKVIKSTKQGLTFNDTYTPMPTNAQFSATKDGFLKMDFTDVPGHSKECYYAWKIRPSSSTEWSEEYKRVLDKDGTGWDASTNLNKVSFTDGNYRLSPKDAYTIKYRGSMTGDRFDFKNPYGDKEWAEETHVIPAYIYPINLEPSEYDQWNNEVKISWRAQRTYKDASTNSDEKRSNNGKWYFYREYNGERKPLGSPKDDNPNNEDKDLYFIDNPPNANVNYTYRVVFIPSTTDESALTWLEKDLQPTVIVDTHRKVDITLNQVNDSTVNGIKLQWTYYIPENGTQFIVQRREAGGGTWEDIETRDIPASQQSYEYIDPKPTDTETFYDYRILAKVWDEEFYSNIAADCNLLKGTSITSIDVTKGTESNAVVIDWKVLQTGTADTYFNIERRPLVNGVAGDWVKIGTVHGTAAEYSFTDERAEAGSYYEYRVVAGHLHNNQVIRNGELSDIGYSRSVGTVTGHVSYGSGNSVEGVTMRLVPTGTDSDIQRRAFARFIHGNQNGGLVWTADSAHYSQKLNSNKPLSVQMWAAPVHERTYMPLFTLGSKVEVGLQYEDSAQYSVVFFHEGDMKNLGLSVPATRYSHFSVTYDGTGKWRFIINGDTTKVRTADYKGEWTLADGKTDFHVGGASVLFNPEKSFCGLVDEIRLWSRELTNKEVPTNFDRMLSGTENDMVLYWPLDEGIDDFTFDVAKQNGVSNQNHPRLFKNAKASEIVPEKLSIYGTTDADGNYKIEGVPFAAGGTNYKLLPDFGIHEFQPASRSLYISTNSLIANNVDFTDMSSFRMCGYVYYKDTNIPVKGLYMYVDGNLQNSEGKICETNEDGFYEISVPIGKHYIEAKQSGHDMVDGGRWPTQGTYDFQKETYHNFTDATLVNFCGRVAGGSIQESKPIGFGEESGAKNNIGQAIITLALKNNPNLSFNCVEGTTTPLTTKRTFASLKMEDTDSICSTAYTGVGSDDGGNIYIKTDPTTGEFSAMLPPLRYSVTNITIPSNSNLELTDLPDINMTNPSNMGVDTLKIEVENVDGTKGTSWKVYKYNQKMNSIWYAEPTLVVKDKADTLHIGAFGTDYVYDYVDEYGKDTIQVYRQDSLGMLRYNYDYPVFKQGKEYSFSLEGYEEYVNNDYDSPVIDHVLLSNQVLTINNELTDEQAIVIEDHPDEDYKQGDVYDLKSNQIVLDSDGKATYSWKAGLPNPTSPYTRHLDITYERRKRTYSFDVFDGYVFGSLILGNNFVTAGPDYPLMVLRDPPGSNSFTSWTSGKTTTEITKSRTDGAHFGGEFNVQFINGQNISTAEGIGVAVVTYEKSGLSETGGVYVDFNQSNSETTTYTVTNTETISTSADKEFVGSNGDVYIGVSTNFILGSCKTVGFFRDGPKMPYYVKDSVAVSVSDSVGTSFMYTQAEIETKQIPEWKKLRASIQTRVASKAEAEATPNTGKYPLYLTWKDPLGDEWSADSTSYMMKIGTDTSFKEDSVQVLTSRITCWENTIAANEKNKLESRNDSELLKKMRNISFDSGTGYSYTNQADTTYTNVTEWTWEAGGQGDFNIGFDMSSIATFGLNLNLKIHAAVTGNKSWAHPEDNYTNTSTFTYTFSDNGSLGTDHTVDCYKSGNGWSDHFSTKAGQTYCPYEGEEVTKYYNPGTKLGNATIPMQKPQVMVSNGNQNPSSKAVITDVPAGQPALYTLYLSNEVETDMAMTYVLSVTESTNPDGLQFSVDGAKLGNGRNIVVEPGQTVVKTLEVLQTNQSILDYSDVTLTLASDCQDDISSINGVILDKCNVEVHFKPSSSPVKLKADAFTVNTVSSGDLRLTLTDFNRSFQNLKCMGVQYKAEGNDGWSNLPERYVFNAADSTQQNDIVVPATGDIKLLLDMSDNNNFPDRTYIFRAYTETQYGAEGVRAYSDEISVVKDMHRPTAIGTPLPADGILHAGDDIVVEFNEDIVPGFVNASNVAVTGKVNDQPTTHEVSMHLSGQEPTAATASDFYMQGNSTLATWLKYTQPGTLLTHCKGGNEFTLKIDKGGHLAVEAGQIKEATQLSLPTNEWMYLVYSYDEDTKALRMIIQHENTSDTVKAVIGEGRTMKQVVYSDDKRLFLGGDGLEADLHDMRIYGICRNPLEVASEKYNSTSTYTAGLMAHWPMDEGQGTKARDLRNDAHPLVLTAPNWRIDGTNYAATVDATKQQHLDLNIGGASTDNNESYVVEFWFKADGDMAGKTLMQAGTDYDNNLRLFTLDDGRLVFGYGINSKLVAPDGFDLTGGWHHFALNVTRGSSASVAIDGKRTAVMSESAVPPLEGGKLVLGAGFTLNADDYNYSGFMTGAFDEVRVWKGILKPEVVQANMYQCLDTLEAAAKGLTVYYPMEAQTTEYGVEVKKPSDKDFAPGQIMPGLMTGNFDLNAFSLNAPPLRKAPGVKTIVSDATVSDRKVYIQLNPTSLADIEGATLDVTVSKIFDTNGNSSLPITWQVYVHQNTLSWAKDSVTCIKDYGDEASFQVEIVNSGKATEYYTISDMPTWLTTDYTYGEVAPEKRQNIRFDVLPTAPVGTYDVNLTLTGNNEIAEPLRIVLKVKGIAPDWAPADTLADQMNIVSQVIIDGIVNENVESRLGAFIGTTCVGVASPEKARGSYYIPMTIYGDVNEHKDKAVSFKFWDASTGVTYVGMEAEPNVKFLQDGMKGSYNYPVILTNTNEVEQRIDVAAGWNWISTNVRPADGLTLTEVLVADGFQQNDIIKDKFNISYYYDGNGWNYGTLKAIQPARMYKLSVQQPVSMVIKGEECLPSQTPIKLSPKWNWIGYVPQTAMEINYALGGMRAIQGDYIKSKSAFAMYGPYGWEGNLKTLEPGKGYMYYSQQHDTLTFRYPDVSAASRAMARRSIRNSQFSIPQSSPPLPLRPTQTICLSY